MKIKIGSRASQLALSQSEAVQTALIENDPGLQVEIEKITTKGDRILHKPLAAIGDKGLFIKEIEHALLEGTIDLAVHSLKDVPSKLDPRFQLFYFGKREDAHDAFVSRTGLSFLQLPKGAIVGTGSIRRVQQLKAIRNDLIYKDIRGNVLTRLEKLDAGQYDALVLASAGLKRLGLEERITHLFSYEECVPACGQGILAIEVLKENSALIERLQALQNERIDKAAYVERGFLEAMDGSCHLPIGAYYEQENDRLYTVFGNEEWIQKQTLSHLDREELLKTSVEMAKEALYG